MFTPEDSLDVLDENLGYWRRRLGSLERAPLEGRVADADVHARELARVETIVRGLERERAGIIAERVAEAEGFAA